jgi:hypothetical protein
MHVVTGILISLLFAGAVLVFLSVVAMGKTIETMDPREVYFDRIEDGGNIWVVSAVPWRGETDNRCCFSLYRPAGVWPAGSRGILKLFNG